ncbi:MAG: hypothetical protein Phyf2KO_08590 [Phycisphaerales bacterium]
MHTDYLGAGDSPRPILRDLALLTILCAIVNTIGLTDFGVANWQESIRLVTSQDMQDRGEWIVPTINGEPYLRKPPLVYWCTITFAEITGSRVTLGHLRLTVAIFGWLSVIMTYLAGRSILSTEPGWSLKRASHAAWWAALFLATGLLHVRMSRTGAIDVAATPFVIGAVWAGFISWRSSTGWQLRLGLFAIASLTAAGAALVKGPPTVLAIFCPLVGVLGWLASQKSGDDQKRTLTVGVAVFLAVIALEIVRVDEFRDALGMVAGALGTAYLLVVLSGLVRTNALTTIQALWRSQLVAISLGAIVSVAIWSKLVASRIGAEFVSANAAKEMGDNIDIFRPSAAAQLFEATSYGAGLGSLWAFGGAWALLSRRERMTPGLAIIAAWVGVTLVAFAAFSTGSGRYITPMWPGVALLGAVGWISYRDRPGRNWFVSSTYAVILLLAIGQAWWYADGRNRYESNHSPRDFMTELASRDDIDRERVAAWGFWNGALTSYLGHHVVAIDRRDFPIHSPSGTILLDEFVDMVREDGQTWVLLVSHPGWSEGDRPVPPIEIQQLGLTAEYIPINARYGEKKGRHEIHAFRVFP